MGALAHAQDLGTFREQKEDKCVRGLKTPWVLAQNDAEDGRQGPHAQDSDMENTAGCPAITLSNLPSIITPKAKWRRDCGRQEWLQKMVWGLLP